METMTHDETILYLARKYIWWKTPEEASAMPERVLAQVMNIGDYDDLLLMKSCFDDDTLRNVIAQAEAGQFNARSWHYWHYMLGLAEIDRVPPLPTRCFS